MMYVKKMANDMSVVLTKGSQNKMNKVRKRKINMQEWKDIKRKRARDHGEEYISKRGVHVPAKIPPSSARICKDVCKKEGCASLTLEQKLEYYQDYYKLSYDDQSCFLMQCMTIKEPTRRKKGKTESNSRRLSTFTYAIKNKEVCQRTLLHTFSLTQRRLQTLQTKIKNGVIVPKDQRGKHDNRPYRTPDSLKSKIREHIESLPKQLSHYSRHKTECEYLPAELNINKMVNMFKTKYPEFVDKINRTLYLQVFREITPHLRFGLPRSDTCKYCDSLYIKMIAASTTAERDKWERESLIHHMKSDQAYKHLAEDTDRAANNPNVITICVDLQQVLFCPTLTHSSVFYQRQLSCYNLGINNVGQRYSVMNLWNETIAKRGSAEIASCILKYILDNFKPLEENQERKLIVWSDRCVGQNNNWRILTLYAYLVKQQYFTEVNQKFLCSGHSFLPCDRDFALIERRKKVRHDVFLPTDWKYVIGEARLNKPFLINELEQKDFKDLSHLETNLQKNTLKITQVAWLKLTKDDPMGVYVRESHNSLRPWIRHDIFKKQRAMNNLQVPPESLPVLYKRILPITKEKKKDLLDMTQYLRPECAEFYINLPTN